MMPPVSHSILHRAFDLNTLVHNRAQQAAERNEQHTLLNPHPPIQGSSTLVINQPKHYCKEHAPRERRQGSDEGQPVTKRPEMTQAQPNAPTQPNATQANPSQAKQTLTPQGARSCGSAPPWSPPLHPRRACVPLQ
jgi:hypothetical protein